MIRGGDYGRRPYVPRLKAKHMAAPTKAASVKRREEDVLLGSGNISVATACYNLQDYRFINCFPRSNRQNFTS